MTDSQQLQQNQNIILICGDSGAGKSRSLKGLKDPEGVMYLNCESNKALPFREGKKFWNITVTDPYQIHEAFVEAENHPDVHTIVVDTITMAMDMFESQLVLPAVDTQKQWGAYHQFFLNLMQQYAACSTKRIVVLAHVSTVLNEEKGREETKVKVKGALQSRGVEAYFNFVLYAKCMPLKKLDKYANSMLTISEDEKIDGYKHVFQTRKTKETTDESIRSPDDMWTREETFINNDVELVFQHIDNYYA